MRIKTIQTHDSLGLREGLQSFKERKRMSPLFNLDENGHLKNMDDWNETWLRASACSLGIERMSDQHRQAIQSVRMLFIELGRVPSQRILFKALRKEPNFESFDAIALTELFPNRAHPLKQLCFLAGLPAPQHCL